MTTLLTRTLIAAAALSAAGIASPLPAGEARGCVMPAPPVAAPAPVLDLAITTGDATARALFGAGLTAYWAGDAFAALHAFRAAQAADPACAMCHWGEALALGPRPNAPMPHAHIRPAWEAILRAESRAQRGTGIERELIAALRHRYGVNPMALREAHDVAWAAAMEQVAQTYPSVSAVTLLLAEALAILRASGNGAAG